MLTKRGTRLPGPLKVALLFAALAIVMTLIGILRGQVSWHPLSILIAIILSGGTWGIVSWAIATAASDVERDVHDAG